MFSKQKVAISGIVYLFLSITSFSFGNTSNYRIYITDIQREVYENWLRIPHSVDYTAYWDFYQEGEQRDRQLDISSITHFRALCIEEGKSLDALNSGNIKGNFYTF